MTFNSEWHLRVLQNVNKPTETKKKYYYKFTEINITMASGFKKRQIFYTYAMIFMLGYQQKKFG